MSDDASARRDAVLLWRQRIADKQAARRQPDEAPATKPNSRWDPEALFRGDDPSRTAPDEEASRAATIDLRDAPEAPVAPAPPDVDVDIDLDVVAAASAPPRDLRKERFDSVMARLQGSPTEQDGPTADVGDLEASRGRRRPPTVDLTPIAARLRDLNQRRLEGTITEEEFKTRKAELFERAPRP
jgi:hypothetical protein